MSFVRNIQFITFLVFSIICINHVFAETDPLNQEVQTLTAMPTKVITQTEEGDTVETLVYTGSDNAVGTIKKKDGSIIQFSRTSAYGWGYNYSFTDSSGNKTTATQDKNWVVSGNGQEYVRAAQKTNEDINDHIAGCSSKEKLCTITTEEVPGADCRCIDTTGKNCTVVETRKYECSTGKWLTGFQQVVAKIIRFVINIVLLLGVLAVVWLGIAWSFAGWDDVKMKSTIKTWWINIVIGLLIMFMFGYILRFLAPWVYL